MSSIGGSTSSDMAIRLGELAPTDSIFGIQSLPRQGINDGNNMAPHDIQPTDKDGPQPTAAYMGCVIAVVVIILIFSVGLSKGSSLTLLNGTL
jgi:hypothetical protein